MGKVEIDHTGSGSGITLSSDGTSLLLGGTAIGGGGGSSPDLYAENYDGTSTKPSATGLNAIALGYDSVASGTKSLVLLQNGTASGNRALSAGFGSTASGTNSVAFGSGAVASGNYSYALGSSTDSTHSYSVAMGYSSQALADYSIALGRSHVSGSEGFAAQIGNSTTSYGASGANSIAMGLQAKATTEKSVGIMAQATGNYAIAIGDGTVASGSASVALGRTNNASATYTVAIGSNCSIAGFKSVGIGRENTISSSHESSLVLGEGIQSTASNQVSIGGTTQDVRISEVYTLPKVDGTASGQVLTTDGSGVVSWATPSGGGGGADLYDANESSPTAQPSATGTNAIAIGDSAISSNTESFALAKSRASGTSSFAAQIGTNSASYGAIGSYSIALGSLAKATGQSSVCLSNTSTASASNSAVLGGSSGTASGSGSVALGGSSNVADGAYSTAKGYYGNANGIRLKHATGVYPNQQGAYYVLGHTTSNATPIALNTSVWTPSATNQITLPNNSAITFSGTVVARQQSADGTASAAWKVEGLIRREANAGSTVLVASTVTAINNTPSWGLALTADTSFGCLKIEATGASSTDIRWVATINTSEVTYA